MNLTPNNINKYQTIRRVWWILKQLMITGKLKVINIKKILQKISICQKISRELILNLHSKGLMAIENYTDSCFLILQETTHLSQKRLKSQYIKATLIVLKGVAHTLKGIGGNLSAGKIVTAARTLEYAITSHKDEIAQYTSDQLDGRQNRYGILNDDRYNILLTNLNDSINPLIQAIQSIVNIDEKRDEHQTFPIDLEHVQPIIIQLAHYLRANDANSLTSFEALKNMMINSMLRGKILEMESHIDNFDFVNALSVLRTIAQNMDIKDRDLE